MTTDLEDALRTALTVSTAGVVARPGLLADVQRGGRRRQWRTRGAVALAGALAVAAVAAGATAAVRQLSGPSPGTRSAALAAADRALLTRPTKGELAHDRGYLAKVVQTWQRSHATSPNADRGIFDHLLGEPHVVWAGNTPAGPAAIVVQAADLRHHANIQLDREGPALLTGFVGSGDGGAPTVFADTYPAPGAPQMEASFIDPARTVLLVLDRGRQVDVSFRLSYSDDGYVRRTWQPVRFRDGAAVLKLAAGVPPVGVRLRNGTQYGLDIGHNQYNEPGYPLTTSAPQLDWADDGNRPVWAVGTNPTLAWGGRPPDAGTAEKAFQAGLTGRVPDLFPDVFSSATGTWFAFGTTADGSKLLVGESLLDADPGHAYVLLTDPTGQLSVAARLVEPNAALPVAVPLPRGQGWVVAQKNATLRWSTNAGPWTDAGTNAALLPATAKRVEVTMPDRATLVVPLHH